MEPRYLTPLSPQEQLALGLPESWPMAIADRVRFTEIDDQNHVSNRSYHDWFEGARIAYYHHHCNALYGDQPLPRFVMRSANVRYHQEMLRNETYVATARVMSFRSSSYVIAQEIWSGTLRCRLEAVMVMLRPDGSGERYPLPAALTRRFVEMDGATGQAGLNT